jgi:glycosyltransferase involved in cell wall biosynthesis
VSGVNFFIGTPNTKHEIQNTKGLIRMSKNIGFISTRFAGTDGVSLEASKWASVLRKNGHRCFWFAGELDRTPERSMLVPEAHFQHEENRRINERIFGRKSREAAITDAIHSSKSYLKSKLYIFLSRFNIDLLIAENVLTIPMQVPLGIALTEIIAETLIPTIAHHHDFYWERTRYLINAVGDYLRMAFPPNLHNIKHVVINSQAQEELALRSGISSLIIPNVLEFENPPPEKSVTKLDLRERFKFSAKDVIILQPTRVVQRKGIEHAIELVKELKDPRYKLVISHEAGDEGYEYAQWLKEDAHEKGVDLRFLDTSIQDPWGENNHGVHQLSLYDIYPHADLITYPSLYEGFGNAFLEAVYFKKPLLINRYAIFVRDIEPQGFDLIVMDGLLTSKNVQKVREVLESEKRRLTMVEHNYDIASRHYSYTVLESKLSYLLINFFGADL